MPSSNHERKAPVHEVVDNPDNAENVDTRQAALEENEPNTKDPRGTSAGMKEKTNEKTSRLKSERLEEELSNQKINDDAADDVVRNEEDKNRESEEFTPASKIDFSTDLRDVLIPGCKRCFGRVRKEHFVLCPKAPNFDRIELELCVRGFELDCPKCLDEYLQGSTGMKLHALDCPRHKTKRNEEREKLRQANKSARIVTATTTTAKRKREDLPESKRKRTKLIDLKDLKNVNLPCCQACVSRRKTGHLERVCPKADDFHLPYLEKLARGLEVGCQSCLVEYYKKYNKNIPHCHECPRSMRKLPSASASPSHPVRKSQSVLITDDVPAFCLCLTKESPSEQKRHSRLCRYNQEFDPEYRDCIVECANSGCERCEVDYRLGISKAKNGGYFRRDDCLYWNYLKPNELLRTISEDLVLPPPKRVAERVSVKHDPVSSSNKSKTNRDSRLETGAKTLTADKPSLKGVKCKRGRRSRDRELAINKEARKLRESLQSKETITIEDLQDTSRFCYKCKTKMGHSHHIFCPMSPKYDEKKLRALLQGTSKGCMKCRMDMLLPKGKARGHEHIPGCPFYKKLYNNDDDDDDDEHNDDDEEEEEEEEIVEEPSKEISMGTTTERKAVETALTQQDRTNNVTAVLESGSSDEKKETQDPEDSNKRQRVTGQSKMLSNPTSDLAPKPIPAQMPVEGSNPAPVLAVKNGSNPVLVPTAQERQKLPSESSRPKELEAPPGPTTHEEKVNVSAAPTGLELSVDPAAKEGKAHDRSAGVCSAESIAQKSAILASSTETSVVTAIKPRNGAESKETSHQALDAVGLPNPNGRNSCQTPKCPGTSFASRGPEKCFKVLPFADGLNYRETHFVHDLNVLVLSRGAPPTGPWGFGFHRHEPGGGCLITAVQPGSPASAGHLLGSTTLSSLRVHDMILSINGSCVGGLTKDEVAAICNNATSELQLVLSRWRTSARGTPISVAAQNEGGTRRLENCNERVEKEEKDAGDPPRLPLCVCGKEHNEEGCFWMQCDTCDRWHLVSEDCVGFNEDSAMEVERYDCWDCDGTGSDSHPGERHRPRNEEPKPKPEFFVGDVVKVNDQAVSTGGVGRIIQKRVDDNGDRIYDVRYVLGGKATALSEGALEPHNFEGRRIS